MAKLSLTVICVRKEETQNGGNTLLATDPKPVEGQPGKSETKKSVQFLTTINADLEIFKAGESYAVTIERIEKKK